MAFRFCFAYLGLFCLWFAQITFVFTGIAGQLLGDQAIMWQMVTLEPVTGWVGRHVLGVNSVIHQDSGSGDQAAVWVGVFCVLMVAVIITVIWSVLDRRRTEYPRLSAGSWSSCGYASAARCSGTASPRSFRRRCPARR